MAGQVDWQGDKEFERIVTGVSQGLVEFHLRVETEAKSQLRPGRGKVTGTLQRSIHSAGPRYKYGRDDVKPSASSPNRSGSGGQPDIVGKFVLRYQVGTGMKYAKRIEALYGFLAAAYAELRPQAEAIITKHTRGK